MKILVTGATGFVGRALAPALAALGDEVRAAVRRPAGFGHEVVVADSQSDWSDALRGIDCVVHLANRAHVMREKAADPLSEFRRINRDGTLHLAAQARASGVRRLVFVSSVKVNGEETGGKPFSADDPPCPQDPYGISKREAEDGLLAMSGLEVVVVRPPLVYGPGVKGNMASLMKAVARGVPLPLGCATGNRRSLVSLANLCDLLALCCRHPAAAGQVFLVRDGEDLSTAGLVRRMGDALGRPAHLLPVPAPLLRLACRLTGNSAAFDRLFGSLQIDDLATRQLLGWTPPQKVDQGLGDMAAGLR